MSFMYVKAYHGVSNKFDGYKHKPQYLYGFRDCLQKLGFRVDLVPVSYSNCCMIEMCGYRVFGCNIHNLKFNTSYRHDEICQKAIAAVMEASDKFQTARAVLWTDRLLDSQMFVRSQYGPKDYWLQKPKIRLRTFASCSDCFKCCDIKVEKKPPECFDTEVAEENPSKYIPKSKEVPKNLKKIHSVSYGLDALTPLSTRS